MTHILPWLYTSNNSQLLHIHVIHDMTVKREFAFKVKALNFWTMPSLVLAIPWILSTLLCRILRPRAIPKALDKALPLLGQEAIRASSLLSASPSPRSHPAFKTGFQPKNSADNSTSSSEINPHNGLPLCRLNPLPNDYKITSFSDHAILTVHAGGGGNGCISFLRDLHFGGDAQGPPNGGNGGHGGNVYIAASHGETSIHKIGRKRILRAGRGKSGRGSSRDGPRGADIVITVPVGTVVREISRHDPEAEEKALARERRNRRKEERRKRAEEAAEQALLALQGGNLRPEDAEELAEQARVEQGKKDWLEYEYPHYDKWVFYPGMSTSQRHCIKLPRVPRRERLYLQPEGPIAMDLMEPTKKPILIASGGLGGLGNTYFHNHQTDRPMIATKGEKGVSMKIELELKLLANVGFVGLPNAGKSTLLRALTKSKARIGHWAFTTLQPNIGTVVLDNYRGRPMTLPRLKPKPVDGDPWDKAEEGREARTRFTIADIPGLVEGAHLDRGLGMAFLRHVERAGVLAFVIDLSAGPAVKALQSLWKEVGLYARIREDEHSAQQLGQQTNCGFNPEVAAPTCESNDIFPLEGGHLRPAGFDIAGKPWYVIATKGDVPGTEENFKQLRDYVEGVERGQFPHPSGHKNGWIANMAVIPVSAIKGHGMDRVVHWTVGLLEL